MAPPTTRSRQVPRYQAPTRSYQPDGRAARCQPQRGRGIERSKARLWYESVGRSCWRPREILVVSFVSHLSV